MPYQDIDPGSRPGTVPAGGYARAGAACILRRRRSRQPRTGNPQSLNRYAYTLNNPLRYTDPSGHYSDDAIQTYLKNRFGDEWERYWNLWNADAGWMDLLHAAQSGDILTRITTDESGMALLDNLQFLGEGQAILSGVSLIDDISANPNKINNISLDHIFSHRGMGLGVTRFDIAGNISVVKTLGDASFNVHQKARSELRYSDIVLQYFVPTVLGFVNPVLGGAIGFGQAALNREIGELPGNVEGDNALTVGTFVSNEANDAYYGATIASGIRSGYEYVLRGGQIISKGGYYWTTYVPHRPF